MSNAAIKHISNLAAALAYAEQLGWPVFPLHEAKHNGGCSCGDSECGNVGKHPRTRDGFKSATTDVQQIRRWWDRWPTANIGIDCGRARIIVVDVDPRNGGDDSLTDLEQRHGRLPHTVTQCTGGGGQHYIYRMPDDRDFKSGKLALGIDIKAIGGYILGAPSNHASGRRYQWDADCYPTDVPVAPVPDWILASLNERGERVFPSSGAGVAQGFLGNAFRAAGWMDPRALDDADKASVRCPWEDDHSTGSRYDSSTVVFAPQHEGGPGHFHCSHGHCQGRTFQEVLESLPDDAKRVAAANLGREPSYVPQPEDPATTAAATADGAWQATVKRDKNEKLTKDPGNVAVMLANLPDWKGCLCYNAFTDRTSWNKPAPLQRGCGLDAPQAGKELSDEDVTYVHHWFVKNFDVSFSTEAVLAGIKFAAKQQQIHPLQDYISSLRWDGVSRVDGWLHRYLGTADTEYERLVGRWWLISAIARALDPGCQVDHMLVLEGNQGIRKSTTAIILGVHADWTLTSAPDLNKRDEASGKIQGKWIVEFGELDSLKGAGVTRVKDFITQKQDTYRKPYDRFAVTRQRHCVFIGSTNEHEYLLDPTGARRFWPVRCTVLRADELVRDRDQLWAEAAHMFHAGEDWWPTDDGHKATLASQADDRYVVDALEEKVLGWCELRGDGFTTFDVMSQCLGIETSRMDRGTETRVGAVLRRGGWFPRRVLRNGIRARVYGRGGALPNVGHP